MRKGDLVLRQAMVFDRITRVPGEEGGNRNVYAIEGVPGVFKRVKRTSQGLQKPESGNILAQLDGSVIELVPDVALTDELRQAGFVMVKQNADLDNNDSNSRMAGIINDGAITDVSQRESEGNHQAIDHDDLEMELAAASASGTVVSKRFDTTESQGNEGFGPEEFEREQEGSHEEKEESEETELPLGTRPGLFGPVAVLPGEQDPNQEYDTPYSGVNPNQKKKPRKR